MSQPDLKPRSRDVTDGLERAAARGMLRAVGMRDDDFADGIVCDVRGSGDDGGRPFPEVIGSQERDLFRHPCVVQFPGRGVAASVATTVGTGVSCEASSRTLSVGSFRSKTSERSCETSSISATHGTSARVGARNFWTRGSGSGLATSGARFM